MPDCRRALVAAVESLESRRMLANAELIRNGAFEGAVSSADWVRTGAWYAASGSQFHGGSQYAYFTDANGNPVNNLTGTIHQQLTIPSNAVNPTLTFWTKVTTSETTTTLQKDLFRVQIQDASGASVLHQPLTLSNLNAVSTSGPHTSGGKYTPHAFALPAALIGETVRVAFVASTDSANPTTFRVDDVGLSEPIPQTPGTRGQIVGYLPYYRQSLFAQMDLSKLTHINYFAITASSTGALTMTNVNNSNLATVVNAAHAAGVGVSITVGPQSFSALAGSATARATFASNIRNYIVARNLDGVDIDWEPPGNGVDQSNYGLLIHALYEQLNPIGKKITAAVNPWTKEIPVAATKLMDWVNVMCYDFDYANHSTYAAATDGLNQWLNYGVAKDKLMMGVPFYGRSGTSWSNTVSKTYGATLSEYRSLNGVYPPGSADSFIDAGGATFHFNGVNTMQSKVNFVRDNGYAGAMIWELGKDYWESGNYTSYSLLPVVASIRRPDAPTGLLLSASSDSGVSSSDRVTNDATPLFSGVAPAGATVTLYADGVARGSAVVNAGGAWTITSSALPDGAYTINAVATNVNGSSPVSTSITVTIDTTPPAVASSEFQFESVQLVRFDMSEDLAGTFGAADLLVNNLTTSATIPSAQITLTPTDNTYRAMFASVLPDGNYIAAISTPGVTDRAGNALVTSGATRDFFVLTGDANRDRSVNIADFAILAGRFNQPGTFSQGDFNYDGIANIGDFSILASRFNISLLGARPGRGAVGVPPAAERLRSPWAVPGVAALLVMRRLIDDAIYR